MALSRQNVGQQPLAVVTGCGGKVKTLNQLPPFDTKDKAGSLCIQACSGKNKKYIAVVIAHADNLGILNGFGRYVSPDSYRITVLYWESLEGIVLCHLFPRIGFHPVSALFQFLLGKGNWVQNRIL